MKKNLLFLGLVSIFMLALIITGCGGKTEDIQNEYEENLLEKPVIYLYPEETTKVRIQLKYNGEIICTYPDYGEGWNVTANPDGTLISEKDDHEYSYLFWEGISDIQYDMSKGFIVKGEDTASFLKDKCSYIGMTPKEYNELIVYWLPRMQVNTYNLITFQEKIYTDNAELEIIPEPDSVLRVFIAYKALESPISIEEQELKSFKREGFSVVEWGATAVN